MKDIKNFLVNEALFRNKNTEAKTLDIIGGDKRYWDAFNLYEKEAVQIFMTAMLFICENHDASNGDVKESTVQLIEKAISYGKKNYKETYK